MSSSRHRAGFQTLIFALAAVLPLVFSVWLLLANEISLWSGFVLAAASIVSASIGLFFVFNLHRKVAELLRELGQQNRQLQEAHLENERQEYERGYLSRQHRQLSEQQGSQNRAVVQLADELARVADEVRSTAEQAQVNPEATQKLGFLNSICSDLVTLANLELGDLETVKEDFVVDQEIHSLVRTLESQGELPPGFQLLGEDTDISARADKPLFMTSVRTALATLRPFALTGKMSLDVISYLHADLGQVVQLTINCHGYSINDENSAQWFTHFQLHTDPQGHFLGPGLGMMMLKRFCDQLGGTASVSAELREQICVVLTLPLREETHEEEP